MHKGSISIVGTDGHRASRNVVLATCIVNSLVRLTVTTPGFLLGLSAFLLSLLALFPLPECLGLL